MISIHFPQPVSKALSMLQDAGFSAYAVGGCIRDSLLGQTPQDWDITTSALPDQIKRIFSDFPIIPTGVRHGTLTVVIQNVPLEITVFRTESTYSDGRHPDTIKPSSSLEEDLARRDFTINAMAAAPGTSIADPFSGQEDLARRQIRCVGDPVSRFTEDGLRILRALRFSSVLGFSIHPDTAAAIHACLSRLSCISAERISAELVRLLCGKNVLSVLMNFSDVFVQLIPELGPCVGHKQFTIYHLYDVYEHSARSVAKIRPDPVLRLTMLLHDIGKPNRFFRSESGTGHFKGHPAEGVRISRNILKRLRFSNETSRRILTLIRYHDVKIRTKHLHSWLAALTPSAFFDLMEVKCADNAAQNQAVSHRFKEYNRLVRLAQKLLRQNICLSVRDLALSGGDLLEAGYHGQKIGRILKELFYQVVTGQCPNSRNALLTRIPSLWMPIPLSVSPQDEFSLRQAKQDDLQNIFLLYRSVTEHLARIPDNLCRTWRTGRYPVPAAAEQALSEQALYVYETRGVLAGSVILDNRQPEGFSKGDWQLTSQPLIMHTFALHPDCRGGVISRRFLSECESRVQHLGKDGLRLSVYSYNQPAIELFENAGYRFAGTVNLSPMPEEPKWFRLYEKKL